MLQNTELYCTALRHGCDQWILDLNISQYCSVVKKEILQFSCISAFNFGKGTPNLTYRPKCLIYQCVTRRGIASKASAVLYLPILGPTSDVAMTWTFEASLPHRSFC